MSMALTEIQGQLARAGVAGVTIAWADNNGIPRSRTVPLAGLADAAAQGVGITPLFAVFDSHDGITFAHSGLSTPSATSAWWRRPSGSRSWPGSLGSPGHRGGRSGPTGHRGPMTSEPVLELQVARAAAAGLTVRAGFELEFFVFPSPAMSRGSRAGPRLQPARAAAGR